MTIALGIDPGSRNFGYSVVSYTKTLKYKVLETGTLTNTLTSLIDKEKPVDQVSLFSNEVDGLVEKYGVQRIAAERYQNRGIKGSQIELVSIMLAKFIYDAPYTGIAATYVTAAQWKNRINRVHDLKQMYKDTFVEAHEVDATCIALYDGCNYSGQPHFLFMKNATQFLKSIEKVSANAKRK